MPALAEPPQKKLHQPQMVRLRSGVIFTSDFLLFLQDVWRREYMANFGKVLVLDYLRCREGARAGQSWLEWFWFPRGGLSEECFFRVEKMDIYLSPQSQQGLRHRYISVKDGVPFVG